MNRVEQQLERFKDYELFLLADNVDSCNRNNANNYKVISYLLQKPGTRKHSCQITFTPEGISIQGDITPEDNNGSCSRSRIKSLDWFTGELSPDYLAPYFLRHKWSQEECKRELDHQIEKAQELYKAQKADNDGRAEDTYAELEQLHRLHESVLCGEYGFQKACEEEGFGGGYQARNDKTISYVVPGYGYNSQEVAILAAIQQTFRRLYWERKGTE